MRSVILPRAGVLANLSRRAAPGAPSGTVLQLSTTARGGGSSTTSTISLPGVTAGSGIVLGVSQFIGPIASVVGSVNGAYTRAAFIQSDGYNSVEIWYKLGAIAGDEVITISSSVGASDTYITSRAFEIAGLGALDQTGVISDSLTVTADGANAQANELVVGGSVWDNSGNAGFGLAPGYTQLDMENDADNNTACQYFYKVVSAIETSSATVTSNGVADTDMAIATFRLL